MLWSIDGILIQDERGNRADHKIRWAPIIGYEGLYEISDTGKVKSFQRNKERILPPQLNIDKYFYIELSCYGVVKYHMISRLVAKAFIPNPENKPQVNHMDGNKQNNHWSNLEWCTQSENIQHAQRTGLKPMVTAGSFKKGHIPWHTGKNIGPRTRKTPDLRVCSTDFCPGKFYAKGMCEHCYRSWKYWNQEKKFPPSTP